MAHRRSTTIRRISSRKSTLRSLPKYAVTFHAINKWYKHTFEKLGWMVLAKAKGYDYKIADYKKSIEHLLKTIEHVMGEYENHNRIHDLKVMRMNVMELQRHVSKDF